MSNTPSTTSTTSSDSLSTVTPITLLRQFTSPIHKELENSLNLFQRIKTINDYERLLRRFAGYYLTLEERIAIVATQPEIEHHLISTDYNLSKRLFRIRALTHDLSILHSLLNMKNVEIEKCSAIPSIDSIEELMGVGYVMEGKQSCSRHQVECINSLAMIIVSTYDVHYCCLFYLLLFILLY